MKPSDSSKFLKSVKPNPLKLDLSSPNSSNQIVESPPTPTTTCSPTSNIATTEEDALQFESSNVPVTSKQTLDNSSPPTDVKVQSILSTKKRVIHKYFDGMRIIIQFVKALL